MLDAAPLPGSKRVPQLEIDDGGATTIYLWCAGARGRSTVSANTISIVPVAPLPSQCSAEEISRDAGLLAQIAQATGWRRQGDEVDLIGTATLRFRLMTN